MSGRWRWWTRREWPGSSPLPIRAGLTRRSGQAHPAQGVTPTHENQAQGAVAPARAGQQKGQLATPGQPPDRQPGEQGICREAQHPGDDAVCRGHRRQSRHDREGRVRPQPEDPGHRLAWNKGKPAYKCAVVEIDPAFTSQTCNDCGRVDKASRPSQAEYACVACGHADNADLNAARNIMASGTGASAWRGAYALPTPVIRETDRMVA